MTRTEKINRDNERGEVFTSDCGRMNFEWYGVDSWQNDIVEERLCWWLCNEGVKKADAVAFTREIYAAGVTDLGDLEEMGLA
jgi:hypothetical protein